MSIILLSEKGVRQKYPDGSEYNRRKKTKARIRKRRMTIARARRELMIQRARSPIFIVTIIVFLALIGYISVQDNSLTDSGLAYSAQAAEETHYEFVVVHSGDTVWSIASTYNDPSKDIRKQIKEICTLNDIKNGNIYPGQVIRVPIPAHMGNTYG